MSEVVEAAFTWGEYSEGWFARITFPCSVCGRRNRQVLQGVEQKMPLPLEVKCQFGHTTQVVPYRWNEQK